MVKVFLVKWLIFPYKKKLILYSQVLRIKTLYSSPLTFEKHHENLKTSSIKDVPLKSVSEKILEELYERPDRKDIGVPLVVTYDSRFHNLSTFTTKCFRFLYAEEKVKKHFTPATFVSFCSGYSLRNHFVKLKCTHSLGKKEHFVVERADMKLVAT